MVHQDRTVLIEKEKDKKKNHLYGGRKMGARKLLTS